MDQPPATASLIDPASIPMARSLASAPAVPDRAFAGQPLPPPVIWTAVIIAAALPIILLLTLLVAVASANYNFFNWME